MLLINTLEARGTTNILKVLEKKRLHNIHNIINTLDTHGKVDKTVKASNYLQSFIRTYPGSVTLLCFSRGGLGRNYRWKNQSTEITCFKLKRSKW